MDMIKLSSIIIKDSFKKTIPDIIKVNRVKEYIKKYGIIDRPVVLKNGELIDNYTRYIASKEMGLDYIPCMNLKEYRNKYPQYYIGYSIIGKFENKNKKYVWNFPDDIDYDSINVGDKVVVGYNEDGSENIVTVYKIFTTNKRNNHKSFIKKC